MELEAVEAEAAARAEAEKLAERLAEEQAAEQAALDEEEDGKRKTKFNFSGMSFAEYVRSIKDGLNKEMNDIVTTFVKQKSIRHHSVHLSQRKF